MNYRHVIQNYSKILYDQAVLIKALSKVQQDLILLQQLYSDYDPIRQLILRPIISIQEKLGVLQRMSNICGFHKLTINLLLLLTKNNFIPALLDIIIDFEKRVENHLNKISGILITTSKLSDKMMSDIQTLFEETLQKSFKLTNKINHSIIGGAILEYQCYIYDVSILGAIEKLKSNI